MVSEVVSIGISRSPDPKGLIVLREDLAKMSYTQAQGFTLILVTLCGYTVSASGTSLRLGAASFSMLGL